jgi:hypothetical protein
MKKQTLEIKEKTNSFLPQLESQVAFKTFGKGDIDYYVDLYEVEVFADGDWSVNYEWLADIFDDPTSDAYDYIYGSGASSGETSDYDLGLQAVDDLGDDIADGSIIALEAEVTNTGTVIANSASLALTMKGLAPAIIDVLKADAGLISTIGKFTGIAGSLFSGAQFVIGASDGEISPQDWATGANALLGAGAVVVGFVGAQAIAGILGLTAVAVGVYSFIAPGDGESDPAQTY